MLYSSCTPHSNRICHVHAVWCTHFILNHKLKLFIFIQAIREYLGDKDDDNVNVDINGDASDNAGNAGANENDKAEGTPQDLENDTDNDDGGGVDDAQNELNEEEAILQAESMSEAEFMRFMSTMRRTSARGSRRRANASTANVPTESSDGLNPGTPVKALYDGKYQNATIIERDGSLLKVTRAKSALYVHSTWPTMYLYTRTRTKIRHTLSHRFNFSLPHWFDFFYSPGSFYRLERHVWHMARTRSH